MRKSAIALSLLLVLSASVLAACGSDDSSKSSSTTKTATVPDGKLGASVAPAKNGYYVGMECFDHGCSHYSQAREGMRAYCKSSGPVHGATTSWKYKDSHGKNKYENYVCFTRGKDSVSNFYFADQKIVKSVYAKSDQFPQTCDSGWCIDGEWHSTVDMDGSIRNPQGLSTNYQAEWVG